MRTTVQEKIRMLLNLELAKRLLIRFFIQKGFSDSFDSHIYAPLVATLPNEIPQFMGKIEIEPFVEEIDPSSGTVRVGWNLFVLGTNRMYLGNSTHKSLGELKNVQGVTHNGTGRRVTTPKEIIKFILLTLKDKRSGFIDTAPTQFPTQTPAKPQSISTMTFYQKQRPI